MEGCCTENGAIAHINLRFCDGTGDEMFLKVEDTTEMQNVFRIYATRRGVAENSLRFMFDGERINPEDSPKMLDIGDNDHIDTMLGMIGGGLPEEGGAGDEPITLKVRDQSGEEMFFKVKKSTAMRKIMSAFADRKGVQVDMLRFTLDGSRINPEDTPKMLELDEGDQIDVLLEQLGGGDSEAAPAEAPITLRVRDQTGEEMFFKVKKGTAMKKIMQAFAERKGVQMDALRFSLDGGRINAEDTPKMLELEDNDQIDVTMTQLGGGDSEGDPAAAAAADAPITIKVVDQTGEEVAFKVKKSTAMRKIMQAFADRKGVQKETLRFNFDGERVNDDDTPKMLEMVDGDQMDVTMMQLGGGDSEAAPAEAPITLRVRDQTGEEMFFKVKKGTAMRKIMQAFAERKGVQMDALRFSLDGGRINAEDTPKMLELEDNDQIDVTMTQLGGGDSEGGPAAAAATEAPIH